MSKSLAGVDLGAYVHQHLGGEPMTLRRLSQGARAADVNAGYVQVHDDYPIDAYPQAVSFGEIPSSLVQDNMAVFGIYGDGLEVSPRKDDLVIWNGEVYRIYFVDGDSVEAVWVAYASATGATA